MSSPKSMAKAGAGLSPQATAAARIPARRMGVWTTEPPATAPECDSGQIPCRVSEVQIGRTGRLRHGATRSPSRRGPRPGGDATCGKDRTPGGHHLGRSPGLTTPLPRHQDSRYPLEHLLLLLHRYPDGSPKRRPRPTGRPIEARLSHLGRQSLTPRPRSPLQPPHKRLQRPRSLLQRPHRPQQCSRDAACRRALGGAPQRSDHPQTFVWR
jgi:hypothetical protein